MEDYTADWALMGQINSVLATALENFLQDRLRRNVGGVPQATMVLAIHNFHKLMLVGMADQMYGPNGVQRKQFYQSTRDAFEKGMNDLIKRIADEELRSAINESEQARFAKEGPH